MHCSRRIALCAIAAFTIAAAEAQVPVLNETSTVALVDGQGNTIPSANVALDGSLLVVGNSVDNERGVQAGAAHVLERNASGTWTHVAKLTASNAAACRRFGRTVEVRNGIVLVGGGSVFPGQAANNCQTNPFLGGPGDLYGFESLGGAWTQTLGESRGYPFGLRISADGASAMSAGAGGSGFGGFVFRSTGVGSWSTPAFLPQTGIGGQGDPEYSGPRVGISGDHAILGTVGDAFPNQPSNVAQAAIYERDASGSWQLDVVLIPGHPVNGRSSNAEVSIDGSIAAVDQVIYERDSSGTWTQTATLQLPGVPSTTRLIVTLGAGGRALARTSAGASHLFQRQPDGTWSLLGVLAASDGATITPARFGSDGTIAAATTGRAYLFAPTGGSQQFSNVDPYLGNRANYTELNASRWAVVNDGDLRYAITTTDYPALSGSRLGEYALVNDRTYGDFHFTAEAKSTDDFAANEAADYDVVFGYQDADNYYYMMFNHAVALTELFKVVNGQRQTLASYPDRAFFDNDYHTIEVSRTGTLIQVSVGGTQILSANDATFGAGRIGIGSFNDSVRFDDVTITTPGGGPGPGPGNVVIEAESMQLSNGYSIEAGTQIVLPDDVQGYATQTFDGESGVYDIEVQLIGGPTGLSVVEFYQNEQRLDYLYYGSSPAQQSLIIPGVSVNAGDFILLAGYSENGGGARVDKIVFTRR